MGAGQVGPFPLKAPSCDAFFLTDYHKNSPPRQGRAQVAQLVEHATENRGVGGSIPPLGTISLVSHKSKF